AKFDMTRPPLLRFALIGLGGQRWRVLLTGHHILWDGWSTWVLTTELLRLYASAGDDAGLPPVTPFRDYLAWLAGQEEKAARDAWRRRWPEPNRRWCAPATPPRRPCSPLASVKKLR